ncbi:MAG: SRPBCC family protein [Chloroflexaceae bacterium]|nr:SRPBCC family protein [Chloroflexaceae bacterium]
MPTIISHIIINRSLEEVYAFVATPGHWPRWHPSSLGVSGAVDHPLGVGEQVTEEFDVAGRRGSAVWTVTEAEPPHRWVIVGQIVGRGSGGTVAYQLTPHVGGTHFERRFRYRVAGPLTPEAALLLQGQVQAESDLALRQLKQLLEKERA